MLEIENLESGYNKMKILKDVSMNITPNEIISLIGPNGAGKSTLLKSIFNLCDIYSGKIIFNGKNITKLPTYNLIYNGISYVPQGRHVFSDLTVKENLEMGAFIFKSKNFVNKKIREIFDRFPFLRGKKEDYAFTLSGGQQQMLAIARGLMQNPKLILLDEPSLGLAPRVIKEIFSKILEINKKGISIIIVEQNAKQAVNIADRTYVLEDGRIVLEGDKKILKDKRIKDIYFGGR